MPKLGIFGLASTKALGRIYKVDRETTRAWQAPLKKQGLANKVVEALPENHPRSINWDPQEGEVEIDGRKRKTWNLTFSINTEMDAYYRRFFGKTAVFTDCHEWISEEIVCTYNSKYIVENCFKWLMDKFLIYVMPVYHRKYDRNLMLIFTCVVGLILVRHTAWKLYDLGRASRKQFEELECIRVSLVQENGTREATFVVEQMYQTQSRIFSRLGLDQSIVK